MATTGEVLSKLLNRAGVDVNSDTLKTVLGMPQLSEVQLPDEVVEQMNSRFLTVDDAKNNADLFNHFKAVHLNGVDAGLEELIKDIQDEAVKNELKGLPTSKRAKRLIEEYKKLADKKAMDFSKDKDGILAELDKLRSESLTKDQLHQEAVTKILTEKENELTEAMMDSYLSSIKYGNEMPQQVNKLTAKQLIAMEMAEKKIGYRRKGMNFELFNSDIPDITYTENNAPVKYEDFVTKVLAKNKMLEVNKPANHANPPRPYQQQPDPAGKPINYAAVSQVQKIKAEMEAASGGN